MTTENAVGIQTRAMTEAQRTESELQRAIDNNQEGAQGANPTTGQAALDPTMNPTVELHKNDDSEQLHELLIMCKQAKNKVSLMFL